MSAIPGYDNIFISTTHLWFVLNDSQATESCIQSCYTSWRRCGCYLLTTPQAIEQKFGKMSFVQGHQSFQPSSSDFIPQASFLLIFVIRQSCRMSSMLLLVTWRNDGGGRSFRVLWESWLGPRIGKRGLGLFSA